MGQPGDRHGLGLAVVRGIWRQVSGYKAVATLGELSRAAEKSLGGVGLKGELGGGSGGAPAQRLVTRTADGPGFQSPCAAGAPHLPSLSEI